jgi:opacity protein-like surface antigen
MDFARLQFQLVGEGKVYMKMCAKLLAITLGCGAVSSSANAEGFFLTADAGVLAYSNTETLSFWGNELTNPGAIDIGAGYRFTPYFGVEAGHSLIGESETSTAGFTTETLKSSVNHVAVVGTLPLGYRFGIFGKLGLARTTIDYSNAGVGISESASGSQTNVMVGFGWEYNFTRHWEVHAQYENFGTTNVGPIISNGAITATGGDIGMSLFSVGGMYSF